MFWQLVIKEWKYQLKNATFYLFIGLLLLFYFTQFAPPQTNADLKPVPGQSYYGHIEVKDPGEQMKAAYRALSFDQRTSSTLRRGIMINKNVKLSDSQLTAVKAAMDKIAPAGIKEGEKFTPVIDYHEFIILLDELDRILGGSTQYGEKDRDRLFQREMTYEEALTNYESIVKNDRLTNAYGRVFADYMGVTAGFFPVFLAAFVLTRDKRSRMQELIYSRRVSSLTYILAKYTAICSAVLVCYLLLATHSTWVFGRIAAANSISADSFAFYRYTFLWLTPTVLFVSALGMLASAIFDNGVPAVLAQFVLWAAAVSPTEGSYGLIKSVIRFNSTGKFESYIRWLGAIQTNRIFYTLLSLVLIALTVWIWSRKRGAVNGAARLFKTAALQRKNNS